MFLCIPKESKCVIQPIQRIGRPTEAHNPVTQCKGLNIPHGTHEPHFLLGALFDLSPASSSGPQKLGGVVQEACRRGGQWRRALNALLEAEEEAAVGTRQGERG